MYKRILLKLSGEQLEGKFDGGIDAERIAWIAEEIKKVKDTEIIVMIGSGNLIRGAQIMGGGIRRITGDNMGMLSTMINALALTDVFNSVDLPTRTLTNVTADQVIDQFTHRRALTHLEKKRVVVIGGGIGRPYFTTDTAAVNLALELDCDAIFKATKVDGVYDSDPVKNPSAKKFDRVSLQEAVENENIRVMDKAAIALAYDHKQPLVVFDLLTEGNIAKAAAGEPIGTTIS